MITYIEKGPWLHEYITEQGESLWQADGIWYSSNDAVVQPIVNNFDPLPYAKAEKIAELKIYASTLATVYYSFFESDPERALDYYKLARDIYLSITPASREALSGDMLAVKNIYDAAVAAVVDINALTDWTIVVAYDVVNTPAWP